MMRVKECTCDDHWVIKIKTSKQNKTARQGDKGQEKRCYCAFAAADIEYTLIIVAAETNRVSHQFSSGQRKHTCTVVNITVSTSPGGTSQLTGMNAV